ncbi:MAG: hypothetical protein AAF386_09210 [Pseudomonadota bacterium]
MGLDIISYQQLADVATHFDAPPKSGIMLGRQTMYLHDKHAKLVADALTHAGQSGTTLADLKQDDGFSETALRALGLGDVKSFDMSDYEGAAFVHDLNEPVPADWHGKFDFIYDGGTIEHVFNVPVALQNMFNLLSDNGVFFSINAMNGWWGHGMYQFSPDLVWSFWKRSAGCEVLSCRAVPYYPKFPVVDLPDPAITGHRLYGLGEKLPESRVSLAYAIRKSPGAKLTGPAQQSDYVRRWKDEDSNTGSPV